mmetsp:Transcript_1006/g.2804  ORF Transcript_1006/g.2804 Transcript_1006/m.2804 type:complete len:299 (+) Transcript_1006:18-914(+)
MSTSKAVRAIRTARKDKTTSRPSLRILTVGDGDLSGSLALTRAYPGATIVATTLLPSYRDLIRSYPDTAAKIVQELEKVDVVRIVYGVDATQLHLDEKVLQLHVVENGGSPFDLIVFQYPHLGYRGNTEEEEEVTNANNLEDSTCGTDESTTHEQKHSLLLAQYLESARRLLILPHAQLPSQSSRQKWPLLPCIHLCLTRSSVIRWNVIEIAKKLKLELVNGEPLAASRPMLSTILVDQEKLIQEGAKAKHEGPNFSGGSRKGHWLGKYGYRHRPTFPDSTSFETNVSRSFHFFWRLT